MNDYFNTYMRGVSTSQRIMQDIITILNRQENTIYRLMNIQEENELINLRRENQELLTTIRNLRDRNRESRESLPRSPLSMRRETQSTIHPLLTQNNRNRTFFNNSRNRFSNNNETFMRNYFQGLPNLIINNVEEQVEMTPVIVRPNDRQIRQATQLIRFDNINDPQNTRCPITLSNFTDQDLVTRIIFCGHIFSTEALQTWFENNVRCPMCRFDIREHRNRYRYSDLNTVNEEETDINENYTNNTYNNDTNDEENQLNNGETTTENENNNQDNHEDNDDYHFGSLVYDSVDALVNDEHSNLQITSSFETIPINNNLLDVFNDISSNINSVTTGRINFIQRFISDASLNNVTS